VSRSGQRTAETVQVHSADPPEHVVRMAPGLALEGVVLAADDRRPVPGAMVTVSPYQILLQPQVTGPDGRFSFGGLLGDPVHLDVRADGFEAVAAGPFRPGGDQGRQVFLQRKRSVVVAGIVVEQGTNRPVEGAQVSAGAGEPARTDRTGAFRLAAPGESFLLAIEAPGFESYAESVDLGSEAPPGVFGLVPSDREAQLRSRLVARIQGRVVDRDGKPVAGAIVDLRPVVPAMAEGVAGRAIVRGGFPVDEARTQTDGDGRFTLFTRLEGGLVVTVHDEGESRDHEVAVVRGSDRQGLQIKIVGKR
jgi:hypothetical protein